MAHWRETAKYPKLLIFDARSGLFLLPMMMYFRWATVVLNVLCIFLFWYLDKKGMTITSAFRAFRAWVIGDHRPALNPFKYRRMIDYQRRENI